MIDKFNFRCYKVLPLVYDESLSYYETVCKLADKINECIDKINEISPDTITEKITAIQNDIEEINETLNFKGTVLVDEEIDTGSVDVAIQNADITNCSILKVYPKGSGYPAVQCVVTIGALGSISSITGVSRDIATNNTQVVIDLYIDVEHNKISRNRSYTMTESSETEYIKIEKIEVLL